MTGVETDAVREVGHRTASRPSTSPRTVRLGATTYPVTLPNIRDVRLHVAAVIVTIHVLGQVVLHFHVSVPQILAAILTCAAIEVAVTFRTTHSFVWPASAMLTGSGVALILRVPSTPAGDHWTMHEWYVFAGVAGFSLLTKYAIRYRGSHVFNPSNVGLVIVFLVFGSTRVEPLDFWWAPLDLGMLAAYAVILVGGVIITRRLQLLASALTFWLVFAAGIGVLAASGHCMVARWAFVPVCGFDFWRVIVTSPEVLIFLLFMITDPKTAPAGRVGRMVFGAVVAVVATVLMAPQTNEFGSKVALLGSLVLVCAIRPLLERLLPEARTVRDDPRRFARQLLTGERIGPAALTRLLVRGGIALGAVALLTVAIVGAGAPARGIVAPAAADVLGRDLSDLDPATLPTVTIAQDVVDWNHEITGDGAQEIVLALAEDLELERRAVLAGDAEMLAEADHGDRLDQMRQRVQEGASGGTRTVDQYRIDDVHITLVVPFGRQAGLSLGLETHGTRSTSTYDPDGGVRARSSVPFATSFVMGRPTGGRWLIVSVQPLEANG